MPTINCPNCNQSYEVDDNVVGEKVECAVCNTSFIAHSSDNLERLEIKNDDSSLEIEKDAATQVTCPFCKKQNRNGENYCAFCGKKINDPLKCEFCNSILVHEAAFCPTCGKKVNTRENDNIILSSENNKNDSATTDLRNKGKLGAFVIIAVVAFVIVVVIGIASGSNSGRGLTIDNLPKGIKAQMVRISKGSFIMENPRADEDHPEIKKQHQVTFSHDYFIGKTEVTQAQWEKVMGTNPSKRKGDSLPVDNVSWHDAQAFCKRLNKIYAGKLPADYQFDLPTEAQWEYAARGGEKSLGYRYSGSNDLAPVAWIRQNSEDKTHPVGMKEPNELGLYDMSGNVSEWCRDRRENDGNYASDPEFLRGNNGSGHVIRGDSYFSWDNNITERGWSHPNDRMSSVGFRIALVFAPPPKNILAKELEEDIARGFQFSDDGKILLEAPTSIRSYTIPNNITKIENDAFRECSLLINITIPDNVIQIGDRAFARCTSLTNITIPSSVTQIGEEAFERCKSLTSITIPESVTQIGDYMFAECTSLTNITIPDSVTHIGDGAFCRCTSLKNITISNHRVVISHDAFDKAACEAQVKRDYSSRIKQN